MHPEANQLYSHVVLKFLASQSHFVSQKQEVSSTEQPVFCISIKGSQLPNMHCEVIYNVNGQGTNTKYRQSNPINVHIHTLFIAQSTFCENSNNSRMSKKDSEHV